MMITVLNHIAICIPFSILLSSTDLGLDGIWITMLFILCMCMIIHLLNVLWQFVWQHALYAIFVAIQ